MRNSGRVLGLFVFAIVYVGALAAKPLSQQKEATLRQKSIDKFWVAFKAQVWVLTISSSYLSGVLTLDPSMTGRMGVGSRRPSRFTKRFSRLIPPWRTHGI